MEKTSPRPHTVTIPPLKICTTGTTSKSLGISPVEDDSWTRVLRKRTVDEKMVGRVAEGAASVGTVTGQVSEASAVGAIIPNTAVLRVTRGSLATAGAFILWAVDTEMTCGMALKTTSFCSRDGFWAQAGIVRRNSCWIRGRTTLMKSRSSVSGDVRGDIK